MNRNKFPICKKAKRDRENLAIKYLDKYSKEAENEDIDF